MATKEPTVYVLFVRHCKGTHGLQKTMDIWRAIPENTKKIWKTLLQANPEHDPVDLFKEYNDINGVPDTTFEELRADIPLITNAASWPVVHPVQHPVQHPVKTTVIKRGRKSAIPNL